MPAIHHLGSRVVLPARLEQGELAAAVDLEIGVRIPHAVDVAHLAGQVEDHLARPYQVGHRRALPDIRDVDAQPILDAVDVEEIATVVVDERIDDQDVGAEIDERHARDWIR